MKLNKRVATNSKPTLRKLQMRYSDARTLITKLKKFNKEVRLTIQIAIEPQK